MLSLDEKGMSLYSISFWTEQEAPDTESFAMDCLYFPNDRALPLWLFVLQEGSPVKAEPILRGQLRLLLKSQCRGYQSTAMITSNLACTLHVRELCEDKNWI